MKPLITAEQLGCVRGGIPLFEQLDFSVAPGEIVQIIGPNGCGKTTLLRFLAGLSSAYDGKITINNDGQLSIIYVGHKSAIKSILTPLENLQWYEPSLSKTEIIDALKKWKLSGYENVSCHQLSAGQQQRVALTRLLLGGAKLWLLDEPFTALDQSGIEFLEVLLTVHAERGGAVVLTTHHRLQASKYIRCVQIRREQC